MECEGNILTPWCDVVADFLLCLLCVCRIPNCGTLVQVQRRRNEREERRKCIKCIRCRHYKVIRVCSRVSPKTHPLNFLYVIMYVSLSFIVSLLAPPPRSFFFHPDIGFRRWLTFPLFGYVFDPLIWLCLTIIGSIKTSTFISRTPVFARIFPTLELTIWSSTRTSISIPWTLVFVRVF